MLQELLLPPTLGLHLEAITITDEVIFLTVTATVEQVVCPQCAHLTAAIHSHYTCRVADPSVVGVRIQMNLHVRRFFCRNLECSRKIFAECLTPFINAYARRTTRSHQTLEQIGDAQRGAPTAQQVVDRFHLLQNLRDAVQRLMDKQQRVLRSRLNATNQFQRRKSLGKRGRNYCG